jgi:hypothetical protein
VELGRPVLDPKGRARSLVGFDLQSSSRGRLAYAALVMASSCFLVGHSCLALGFYVAVFLALKALLQAALALVSLALAHLPLPYQSLVVDDNR